MEKLRMESIDITQRNVERIGALFPGVITEIRDANGAVRKGINFELLKQELGGDAIDGEECYDFSWVGKKAAIVEGNRPIRKTLRPCIEESKDWEHTGNLYIEGDNLDVLKLLQESYLNSIRVIYIDPPYNTGNDFIYKDSFKIDKDEYDEQIGMYDDEANRLFPNPRTRGRFHSDWCSMLYPRLKLAHNLLREDGVIFISIDDNEVYNLRKICNEVFGEGNFAASVIWQKVYSPRMDVQGFSASHDYILCYVKSDISSIKREAFEQNAKQFNFFDEEKEKWYRRRSIRKEGSNSLRTDAPASFFPIEAPDGTAVFPVKPDGTEGCWRWSKKTYEENLTAGQVEWVNTDSGWQVYAKQYLEENATRPPETLWLHSEVNHNHGAAEEVKKLLDGKVFDSPKPKELLVKMLRIASEKDSIILDFFSGSSTTAHAVMQINAEDGGDRKFIMAQLPEPCSEDSEAYKAGYKNICEIGKERIRRAGEKIRNEIAEGNAQLKIGEEPRKLPDLGFRVLKVDSANMKEVYYAANEYRQSMLAELEANIKEDRNDLDLLYGVLLEWGLPLSLGHRIEKVEGVAVHTVDDADEGSLVACFAERVSESVVREIAKRRPGRVVFRDSSFAGSPDKINVEEIFKLHAPDTTVKVI